MVDRLPLDAGLVARTPPEVLRLLAQLLDRIEKLEAENRDLKARLGLNSSNSSKPPSTDPPNRKRKPPVPKSGRKRMDEPMSADPETRLRDEHHESLRLWLRL